MPFNFEPALAVEYGQIALGILAVAILGAIAYFAGRRGLATLYRKKYISEGLQGVLQVALRWGIIVLVVLVGLQQVGVQVGSIWAALSAVVVLLGVGLVAVWSVLSNILCSLLLLTFRPFNIGDKVEIIEATGGSGLLGKVVNLNLLYTFIHEDSDTQAGGGAIVQVPNNIFFQKTIRRWPGAKTTSLKETIFKDDAQMVEQNVPTGKD